MKITTIVEDTIYKSELLAEHGISMLIEVDGQQILFDTGQSGDVLIKNATTIGIDLRTIDKLILSHGHYDHTGGIRTLSVLTDSVDAYAHSDLFGNKWVKDKKEERYIGIPVSKQAMLGWGFELHLEKEPMKISKSVMTTGEIPRVTEFETVPSRLRLHDNDGFVQDQIYDDLSLVVRSEKGLVLMLGCAHSGLVNILTHVRKSYNDANKIRLVIGGTHLVDANKERIEKTIRTLKEFGVEKIAASHCTGEPAIIMLYQAFGDDMIANHVGDVIEI